MKFSKSIFSLIVVFLLMTITMSHSLAQEVSYALNDSSTMVVKGTSTVHDWEVDVKELNTQITLNPTQLATADNGSFIPILTVTVPVEKMESGKNKMDKKMYGALKADEYPTIYFRLITAEILPSDSVDVSDNTFKIRAKGELSLAGTSKEINLDVTGTKLSGNAYRFTGSYHLNMTDYGIDPPSALFGTIKSGEEVDIEFDITAEPEQAQSK